MRKVFVWLVLVLFLVSGRVVCASYVIDNDGNERSADKVYGDSGLPSSYEGLEYYDCYVPYNLTPGDIGGYANGVLAYTTVVYNYSLTSAYPQRVNNKFAYLVNQYMSMSNGWHGLSMSKSSSGLQTATDSNGNEYYMTAIQKFFYNYEGSTIQWGNQNGQLFDIILTDGTVIHMIVCDANATEHTNGGPAETQLWNVIYTFAELKMEQYKNIFQAAHGNMIEIAGSGSASSEFKKMFGLSLEGTTIAYYRMYNSKVDTVPTRTSAAGKEASYKLDNVSVDANGSNSASGSYLNSDLIDEEEMLGITNIKDDAESISLPDSSSLSVDERVSVEKIKEDVTSVEGVIDIVRVIVVFLGLIMIVYVVFLWLFYAFDVSNTMLDIELLPILTFHRLSYYKEYGKGSCFSRLVRYSVVICIVSALLISGGVYNWIQMLFNIVYDFIEMW